MMKTRGRKLREAKKKKIGNQIFKDEFLTKLRAKSITGNSVKCCQSSILRRDDVGGPGMEEGQERGRGETRQELTWTKSKKPRTISSLSSLKRYCQQI